MTHVPEEAVVQIPAAVNFQILPGAISVAGIAICETCAKRAMSVDDVSVTALFTTGNGSIVRLRKY